MSQDRKKRLKRKRSKARLKRKKNQKLKGTASQPALQASKSE